MPTKAAKRSAQRQAAPAVDSAATTAPVHIKAEPPARDPSLPAAAPAALRTMPDLASFQRSSRTPACARPKTERRPPSKRPGSRRGRTLGGVPEAEALKRVLPDYLAPKLRLVICGINPGVWSAARGHHYAGPGNHFWPCLSASGILPSAATPVTYEDDAALLQHGVGFTNMVARTTRGQADLTT